MNAVWLVVRAGLRTRWRSWRGGPTPPSTALVAWSRPPDDGVTARRRDGRVAPRPVSRDGPGFITGFDIRQLPDVFSLT